MCAVSYVILHYLDSFIFRIGASIYKKEATNLSMNYICEILLVIVIIYYYIIPKIMY